MKKAYGNEIKLGIFTALLGAFCGAVIWLFLKVLDICTGFVWDVIPRETGISYVPVIACAMLGLAAGLVRRRCGDYPEELPEVLGQIKKNRHYDYSKMAVMLVCSFIPLVLGASVGPEAGLTGIIAGLCYWVGDNTRYAKEHSEEYSEIGAAVTLGSLFHVPLFGIFAVEEPAEGEETHDSVMPKTSKLVLYGLSIAAAFLAMKGLSAVFGPAGEGMPSYEYSEVHAADYALLLIYIPAGIILYYIFRLSEKLCGKAAGLIPAVVKETLCGLAVGVMAMLVPEVLFSGEKQMELLPDMSAAYGAAALMGICLLKLFMTAFCIRFGLKGGHFFPVIFACSAMGFALALLLTGIGADPVFAAAAVTAAALGAQMKKPLATSMLLLICFPLRLVLWILVAAAIGSKAVSLRKRHSSGKCQKEIQGLNKEQN